MLLYIRRILQDSWVMRHIESLRYFGVLAFIVGGGLISWYHQSFNFVGSVLLLVFILGLAFGGIQLTRLGHGVHQDADDLFESLLGYFLGLIGILVFIYAVNMLLNFEAVFLDIAKELEE